MLVELKVSTLAMSTLSYSLLNHLFEPPKSRMETRFANLVPKRELIRNILQRGTKHGVQMALWKECLQAISCQSQNLKVARDSHGRGCFFEGSHLGIMVREN